MSAFPSLGQVSGTTTDQLVTSGPYRVSRNPQYLGAALVGSGAALAGRSPRAVGLTAALVVVLDRWVRVEEEALAERFGQQYEDYRRRVGRWGAPDAGPASRRHPGGPMTSTLLDETPLADDGSAADHASRRWTVLVALVGVLGLAVGALLVVVLAPADDGPEPSAVDVGFAQDMKTHHRQAVEMSLVALERTEDPEIRTLAYDIATTQQAQVGMMSAWLEQWSRPQVSPGPPMTWMDMPMSVGDGMDMEDGRMPGMATRAELASLRQLPPDEMDEQFLRLMIDHHVGGVVMAEAAAQDAQVPTVARLAQKMVDGQTAEIDYMDGLLDVRERA